MTVAEPITNNFLNQVVIDTIDRTCPSFNWAGNIPPHKQEISYLYLAPLPNTNKPTIVALFHRLCSKIG
ncbi:hypothetical protein C7B61_20750, partial [filamentous cyanobacterium CCP1]